MLKIISLCFLLLFASCNKHYKPDLNRIKSYNFELEEEWPYLPPYLVELSKDNKTIWYLGANHENTKNSSTFKLIDKFFAEYKPDFVIIEGIEKDYGISPRKILNMIDENCGKDKIEKDKSSCNESLYSTVNANMRNIQFVGAEPSDKEQLDYFLQNGLKEEDYVNFLFTQMILQFYRQGEINSVNDLEKKYMPFISLFHNIINPLNFSYNRYQLWLDQKIPGVKFENLIDSNFTAPVAEGNYLQRLSSLIEYVRDRHIVETIFNTLHKYSKVLVVYGHSHFLTQKYVFEEKFGKYKILY